MESVKVHVECVEESNGAAGVEGSPKKVKCLYRLLLPPYTGNNMYDVSIACYAKAAE